MSMVRLSKEEISRRLIHLRNLERLHLKQKQRIDSLVEERKQLKARILYLESIVQEQQMIIEDFKLQLEELRTMVFGKKKPKKEIKDDDLIPPQEKVIRSSDSYKRPIPKEGEITETQSHPIHQCSCGGDFTKEKITTFYEEDIPVPAQKIVRKYIVTKGYCPDCQKWQSAIPLPSAKVILGPNLQKYICYLNVVGRLSFFQIQEILKDTYQMPVSQGEIAKILSRESLHLRPFYEQLKIKIRGEPVVHLDETSWKLFIGNGFTPYSWVMSGGQSQENIFLIGESRGGGNVEKLIGENFDGFVVTDDYGAYKKLKNHQLCFAHLIRKWRDLAKSGELEEKIRLHCKAEYQKLCLFYKDLKNDRRIERYDDFVKKLTEIAEIREQDPQKLIRYKTTLVKNIPQYLTCLSDPNIPLTNNQAERSLRHLVIKRKISFGSLTKRTADNLAVLLSVIMSMKQRFQANFFLEYLRV